VAEHRSEDDRNAQIESRRQLALLAEQDDGEHDRIDRLETHRKLGAECVDVSQCDQ
jgi:hypothetical protein